MFSLGVVDIERIAEGRETETDRAEDTDARAETAACADGAKVAMLAAVKIAAATTNNADLCLPCIFRIVFNLPVRF
ncbi:hypothetical protein U8040_002831 [Acinetobacter baumannii]|nr:hypothetical protein [Acinetobacter baumannii]EMB2799746.1 hypothetical protein [Acinetobacter baumannii]